MALIKCPECGKEISDRATSCPNCGYPISQDTKPAVGNVLSPNNEATQYEPAELTVNGQAQGGIVSADNTLLQSAPPKKNKKLKAWQKILIGVTCFVIVLAILFAIFILIPAIKCVNAYEAISPYLDYVGAPHPDEDEAITLTQEEYDNIDNVVFMGMRGEMSFKLRDGYISSCTWTSFDFCSEEEYREFAEELHIYFDTDPSVEAESYGNGNTYRYSWIDPYYGFSVTMAHGFFAYDPEGQIEIRWETSEEACDILGHTWIDATCTDPKTCHVCGVTEGEALGHQGSESSEWDIDYDEAANVQEYCCTICEEMIEIQSEPVTTFVNGDHFTIYPAAFADRFEDSSSRLNDIDYYTKSEYNEYGFYDEDNTVFYRIQDKNDDYEDIGMMSFTKTDGKTVAVMNNYTENCVGCINILIEDSYDVSAVVYASILAIDPSIGYSEAADVGQEIVDSIAIAVGDINEEDFQGINYNGINYLLYRDREYHYLVISIGLHENSNEGSNSDDSEQPKQYDEYLTWYNIEFASSFLGKELNADGSLTMGPEDYEVISNDMYLFDIPGRFSHGMSSSNTNPVIIDILDWVTTEAVDDFDYILNPMIERYGDDYRIQHYDDAAGDAYMWKNVEMYEYVICWQNADGTVDIRWTIAN